MRRRPPRRLAVFVGSAGLGLVRTVLADEGSGEALEWKRLDAPGDLVERSRVAVLPAADGTCAEPRCHLLESPLALARKKLHAAGEGAALRRRHVLAVRTLMDSRCEDLLDGRLRFDAYSDSLAPDIDNAQAALRSAPANDGGTAVSLAASMSLALGRERHGCRRCRPSRHGTGNRPSTSTSTTAAWTWWPRAATSRSAAP